MASETTATKRSKGWIAERVGNDVHVHPQNDMVHHLLDQLCWCHPTVQTEPAGRLVTHHSADKRELWEQVSCH
jgi:hypothetical protein